MSDNEDNLKERVDWALHVILRRRWCILLTACGITLATIAILMQLPNRYTSDATVLVIQQQVPERYVASTTTTDISQVLQGMTQEVLSRTRLLSIVDALGLYPKDRATMAPEKIVERMRKDIVIQPLESNPERRNVNAFSISFMADTPQRAQQVTSRLTALFIEENVKTREHQAAVTNDFLQEQLDTARKQLGTQEARLRGFKMQYLGELPEQQQGNAQILGSYSAQLANTMAALSRAQEQKVYLESLLRGYRSFSSRPGTPAAPASSTPNPADAVQSELTRLQSERAGLLSIYTPNHPDVKKKDEEIKKTELLLARLNSTRSDRAEQQPAVNTETPADDTFIAQTKSQLEANRLEIQNLSHDEAELKDNISRYQDRLNASPVREQQLAGLQRDYELIRQNYADLLSKQAQSQLAVSLEKHQEGQQFRLVDPPSLPSVPSSPKRLKIGLGVAAASFFLGFALAFLRDSRDRSFRTESELQAAIRAPIALALPLLLTRPERRLRGVRIAFEWFAASALLLAVIAAELYVYTKS